MIGIHKVIFTKSVMVTNQEKPNNRVSSKSLTLLGVEQCTFAIICTWSTWTQEGADSFFRLLRVQQKWCNVLPPMKRKSITTIFDLCTFPDNPVVARKWKTLSTSAAFLVLISCNPTILSTISLASYPSFIHFERDSLCLQKLSAIMVRIPVALESHFCNSTVGDGMHFWEDRTKPQSGYMKL